MVALRWLMLLLRLRAKHTRAHKNGEKIRKGISSPVKLRDTLPNRRFGYKEAVFNFEIPRRVFSTGTFAREVLPPPLPPSQEEDPIRLS